MSTTVSSGSTATFGMDAFASLAVVPSASDTRGTITFTSAAPNSRVPSFSAKLQAKEFGPFLAPMTVSIVVEDGSCTYQLTGNTGGYQYDSSGNVTGLVGPDGDQFALAKDYTATVMPDEIVRVSSTGNGGSGGPGYVSRIRCITGTSVALTVQDNPGVDVGGTEIYSGTLSAGEEAVLSAAKVPIINGTRLTWTGSASFDVYTGQEAP